MTMHQLAQSMNAANDDECVKLLAMSESLISIIAHDDETEQEFIEHIVGSFNVLNQKMQNIQNIYIKAKNNDLLISRIQNLHC